MSVRSLGFFCAAKGREKENLKGDELYTRGGESSRVLASCERVSGGRVGGESLRLALSFFFVCLFV